jgi:hypothetical protein
MTSRQVSHRDRGSVPLVVAALISVTAVGMVALAEWSVHSTHAARARTVADAAALAAVQAGPQGAHSIAGANDAVLLEVIELDDAVEVLVQVGRATARARATDAP